MEPYDFYEHIYLLIKYFSGKLEPLTDEEKKLMNKCQILSDLYNQGLVSIKEMPSMVESIQLGKTESEKLLSDIVAANEAWNNLSKRCPDCNRQMFKLACRCECKGPA